MAYQARRRILQRQAQLALLLSRPGSTNVGQVLAGVLLLI
jgi:hypothetical protein